VIVGFSAPPTDELREYAAQLYARRGEGRIVEPARVEIGDWEPVPNECHHNATTIAANSDEYQAVRGWLYFNFADALPFVRFTAHSVVRNRAGQLWDITPYRIPRRYPFIVANLTDEAFQDMILALQAGAHLDHAT
jgi:hypothetical protein